MNTARNFTVTTEGIGLTVDILYSSFTQYYNVICTVIRYILYHSLSSSLTYIYWLVAIGITVKLGQL